MTRNKLAWSAALLMGCVAAEGAKTRSANAVLLVYEPFAYADGGLTGQGGALGTTGTWTAWDTHNGDWFVHQQGDIAGIVVDPGPPIVRNMFDGVVDNLETSGGYAGLPGPEDVGRGTDEDFEIGRYMDASIALAPNVTATFASGTTTWFSFVTARGWDRNERTPHFIIGTDTTPNNNRGLVLSNSGSGIGGGGGAPRNNRTDIFPQYFSGGLMNNALGTDTSAGFNDIPELPDATHTMPWDEFDGDGNFGPPNIVVGKIEWDADTGGEDMISVVRFLETDTLSEAAFNDLITAKPALSSANWLANKPDLDQTQFDTIDFSCTKCFVDEIRVATTFGELVGTPTPVIPGDVNGDQMVDLLDFEIILMNFYLTTSSPQDGDLNADGIVNFADFRLWKNAVAGVAASASSAAVPEPATPTLIAVALVCCACRCRRDRTSHVSASLSRCSRPGMGCRSKA